MRTAVFIGMPNIAAFLLSVPTMSASLQKPSFHERDKRVSDDDVVKKLDAEQFPALLEPAGDLDVFPTRCGVQGGMIV